MTKTEIERETRNFNPSPQVQKEKKVLHCLSERSEESHSKRDVSATPQHDGIYCTADKGFQKITELDVRLLKPNAQ